MMGEGDEIEEPTLEEVKEVIKRNKKGKAPRCDNINMELIKYGGEKEQEKGIVITVHKKGDTTDLNNYRGIRLLTAAYKITSALIQQRLTEQARNVTEDYQCGVVKGRFTVDAIHFVKQIMEKAYEHNMILEMLFIDFRPVFATIKKNKLITALEYMKIEPKIIRLVEKTLKTTRIKIRTEVGETEIFSINRGVKQRHITRYIV